MVYTNEAVITQKENNCIERKTMQSLFEPKIKNSPDFEIFNSMKKKAIELLSNADNFKYTQAIVLRSSKGNEYGIVIRNALSEEKSGEEVLLQKIQDANDSAICFVLCMWQGGCIDIPSCNFRKLLLRLNEKNSGAKLFVMTAGGVSEKKLSATINE